MNRGVNICILSFLTISLDNFQMLILLHLIQTNVLSDTHFLSSGLYLAVTATATDTSYHYYIYDTADLNAEFGLWNELAKLIKKYHYQFSQ